MDFKSVQQQANNPIWDNEPSKLVYDRPAPNANALIFEDDKLLEGIPDKELGTNGLFMTAASPLSHIGPYKNAIDFLIYDGTPVLAAYDGVITEVKEDSRKWGDGEKFRDHLNYITVQHGEEFTQYCHLAKNSVRKLGLKVGDQVTKGQQIATVGKTGWTDRDHLHFIVFRSDNNQFGFKSLVPRFY